MQEKCDRWKNVRCSCKVSLGCIERSCSRGNRINIEKPKKDKNRKTKKKDKNRKTKKDKNRKTKRKTHLYGKLFIETDNIMTMTTSTYLVLDRNEMKRYKKYEKFVKTNFGVTTKTHSAYFYSFITFYGKDCYKAIYFIEDALKSKFIK